MTLDVRYHPEAVAEFRADVSWYEERVAGLGDRFEMSVDEIVDSILEWPESGAVWPSCLQRADGTICASRTWEYNDGPASAIYVPTNQGKGSCASWSSLRAAAMGRVYRASTAQYITASSYIYSPYAN